MLFTFLCIVLANVGMKHTVYSGLQSGTLFNFFTFGQDCIQNRTLFETGHYYSLTNFGRGFN